MSGNGFQTTGVSLKGSVGTSVSQLLAPASFKNWLTIQNTHASQSLAISFVASVAVGSDFTLAPGAALTLPYGPLNALYGIGSGAGTTFAIIGF